MKRQRFITPITRLYDITNLVSRWSDMEKTVPRLTRTPGTSFHFQGCGGPYQGRAIATRRKGAGMEVRSLLGLRFGFQNNDSSSFCRSVARPFFSAASNAFIVGP